MQERKAIDFGQFRTRAGKAHYASYMAMVFSRISLRMSYVLIRTPVTPNQVTLLSTTVGLIGAAMILSTNYWFRILGIVVWFLAYILDFCDGEIARYEDLRSEFGHWFDMVTDRVKDVGLFTAITLLAVRQSNSTITILLGLLALGGTIVYSFARTYSYQKTRDKTGSEEGLSPEKFGNVNYLVMAVLVGLDLPGLFLAFVTAVTYVPLAMKIYSNWRVGPSLEGHNEGG